MSWVTFGCKLILDTLLNVDSFKNIMFGNIYLNEIFPKNFIKYVIINLTQFILDFICVQIVTFTSFQDKSDVILADKYWLNRVYTHINFHFCPIPDRS